MALTEQVLMPGADYQEIADQTRTLDGTSETLKSGEVAAKLQAANTTVAAQTAQINALIEQANSLPEAGGGGGGSTKEWTKIIDLDFSEADATNIISITDLPNVTEFYFLGSSLATDESSDSGFSLFINSNLLVESGQLIRIGKSSRGVNQYATVKFNGLFWDILSSTQTTAVTSKIMGTARLNSFCVPDVGPAESLKLQIPTYLPISGTLEVWAR